MACCMLRSMSDTNGSLNSERAMAVPARTRRAALMWGRAHSPAQLWALRSVSSLQAFACCRKARQAGREARCAAPRHLASGRVSETCERCGAACREGARGPAVLRACACVSCACATSARSVVRVARHGHAQPAFGGQHAQRRQRDATAQNALDRSPARNHLQQRHAHAHDDLHQARPHLRASRRVQRVARPARRKRGGSCRREQRAREGRKPFCCWRACAGSSAPTVTNASPGRGVCASLACRRARALTTSSTARRRWRRPARRRCSSRRTRRPRRRRTRAAAPRWGCGAPHVRCWCHTLPHNAASCTRAYRRSRPARRQRACSSGRRRAPSACRRPLSARPSAPTTPWIRWRATRSA